jgi:ankyrin repeat protein
MAKDVDRIKLLLSRNCDVTAANEAGSTALHLASDPDIVNMLLEAVPDEDLSTTVNAMDANGECNDHTLVSVLANYSPRK